jgi:hypothetical protein
LAERSCELGGDDPTNRIDAATGRERNDQRDRTGRIIVRRHGRAKGQRDKRGAECGYEFSSSKMDNHSATPRRFAHLTRKRYHALIAQSAANSRLAMPKA